MKKIKGLLVLICLGLLFVGCSNANKNAGETSSTTTNEGTEQTSGGPLDKYDQPVTIHIGKEVNPNDQSLISGDTVENNLFTRYVKEKLNIDTKIAWQAYGDAYQQKAKLAIASGEMPDIMDVSFVDLKTAYEAGLLEDLTEVYEKYASPTIKEIFESGNNKALEAATFDGKLMAIPFQQATGDHPLLTWVRKDWLDKLGLEEPKTAEDLTKIAKAFMEGDPKGDGKKDIIGIVNFAGFSGIYNAFDSYPEMFVENGGEITYGSLLPGTKDALALLSEWYKTGLLDKEFATRTDAAELIAGGRNGLFFGPWWAPWGPVVDSTKNDPKANWVAYAAPLSKDGALNYRIPSVATKFKVVRKGYSNPEAVMKMINLESAAAGDPAYSFDQQGENHQYWPARHLVVRADDIEMISLKVRAGLENKVSEEELKKWTAWEKTIYDSAVNERDNPRGDMGNWPTGHAYVVGAVPLTGKVNKVYAAFSGVTATMQTPAWSYLTKLEEERFTKIIMGELPVDDFDKFVEEWLKNSGQKVLDEVKEILKK